MDCSPHATGAVEIDGIRIAFASWSMPARTDPTFVLLHHGFGCVEEWGTFPARLAQRLGCPVLAYSRPDCGWSDPDPKPRGHDFVEREAERLLALVERLTLGRVHLIGHSDGGSIALMAAALAPERFQSVAAVAAHVFTELETWRAALMITARMRRIGVCQTIGAVHRNPERALSQWARVWTDPLFLTWSMVDMLPQITCPVLVCQSNDDCYGTLRQVQLVREHVTGPVRTEIFTGLGHDPFRRNPEKMLDVLHGFYGGFLSVEPDV